MRFDNESCKIELRNEIFRKVNEKREKKNSKKTSKGLAEKGLLCRNGSYNIEKDTTLQKEKEKYV